MWINRNVQKHQVKFESENDILPAQVVPDYLQFIMFSVDVRPV